jgi:hypothetical protein
MNNLILNELYIRFLNCKYKIIDIELYEASDPYFDFDILETNIWFFRKKKLYIVMNGYYILINAIKKQHKIITNCIIYFLYISRCKKISEFISKYCPDLDLYKNKSFCLKKKKHPKHERIFATPRVGLTLKGIKPEELSIYSNHKKLKYIMKCLRFTTYPYRLRHGVLYLVLVLIGLEIKNNTKIPIKKLALDTGLPKATIKFYYKQIIEGTKLIKLPLGINNKEIAQLYGALSNW